MKLLTVTNGPTWPGNNPLPAAGTQVGTVRFTPLKRVADGTMATIGGTTGRIVSTGTALVIQGSSGGVFQIWGSTRTTGSVRAPQYRLEERVSIGGQTYKQEDTVEPYEGGTANTWDYRTPPPGGLTYVNDLPITIGEVSASLTRADAAAAQVAADRAAITQMKSDLDARVQGLGALDVRTVQNAWSSSGIAVLWGLQIGDYLPLYLDASGRVRAKLATIETLDVNNLTLNGPFSLTALNAQSITTGTQTVARAQTTAAPESIGLFWAITDRDERLLIGADEKGVRIPRLGPPNRYLAFWGDGVAVGLSARMDHPTVNFSLSGQTSGDMAARFGALGRGATFTAVATNSGYYSLTLNDFDLSPLLSSDTQQQTGRLGGVQGTLMRSADGKADALTARGAYYGFVPITGTTIELNAAYPWLPDNPHRTTTAIIAVGRNDIRRADSDATQAELEGRGIADNVAALIQSLGHDRFIAVGPINSRAEVYGAGLEPVLRYIARLGAVVGDRFLDARSVICRNADGSWRVDGSPNPVYMATDTQMNAAGFQALADALKALLRERSL